MPTFESNPSTSNIIETPVYASMNDLFTGSSHFMFAEGVVEIWLTSEDTGAYGRDIGTSLPELLWKLVEVIPDGARLRVGMTNPPYILEHLEVCFPAISVQVPLGCQICYTL